MEPVFRRPPDHAPTAHLRVAAVGKPHAFSGQQLASLRAAADPFSPAALYEEGDRVFISFHDAQHAARARAALSGGDAGGGGAESSACSGTQQSQQAAALPPLDVRFCIRRDPAQVRLRDQHAPVHATHAPHAPHAPGPSQCADCSPAAAAHKQSHRFICSSNRRSLKNLRSPSPRRPML